MWIALGFFLFIGLHLVHALVFGLHHEWGLFRPLVAAWWQPLITRDFWS